MPTLDNKITSKKKCLIKKFNQRIKIALNCPWLNQKEFSSKFKDKIFSLKIIKDS